MKEATIDGVTYVPVMHKELLDYHTGKCEKCVAEKSIDKAALCASLPQCWDDERTCHFVVKPEPESEE